MRLAVNQASTAFSMGSVPDPFFPAPIQKKKKWSGYARLRRSIIDYMYICHRSIIDHHHVGKL